MAKYFFDYRVSATITRDEYGTVCISDDSAVSHAWSALPHILAENRAILPWQHFEVIVRREDGIHVGRLGMTVTVETQNPARVAALASDTSRRNASTGSNPSGGSPSKRLNKFTAFALALR